MKNLVIALLLLGLASPTLAMRCGNRLVGPGDRDFQVRDRCGDPFWIEYGTEIDVIGQYGRIERQRETPIETWTYHFGPTQLMRRLVFRNGVLSREDTLGYGVTTIGSSCDAGASYEGLSMGELAVRCGAPLSRRRSDDSIIQRPAPGVARWRQELREELIYDVGDNRRLRRYRLLNGVVVDADTLPR